MCIGYYKLTKLYSVSISPVIYQSEEDPDILRICHCDSPIIEAYPKNLPDSTCSKRAKARGLGQKVISFALFGEYFGDDGQPNWYSQGAWDNAELLPVYYGSDWIMRLYHNQVGFDEKEMRFLCDLKCNHSHVDLCYVGNIPHYEQIEEHPGTLWRFLPMGDPLVDVFHVRDLDSRPSDRETAALAEFHESQEQFHILRDHRNHRAAILAGMWGGKPSIDRIGMTTLLRKMLTASNKFRDHAQDKVFDQFILTEALFPAIKGYILCGHSRLPAQWNLTTLSELKCSDMPNHIEMFVLHHADPNTTWTGYTVDKNPAPTTGETGYPRPSIRHSCSCNRDEASLIFLVSRLDHNRSATALARGHALGIKLIEFTNSAQMQV
eukprot:TCALIF_01038-PB protein Name:"Protein of unknown function" AED:0.44 eAED:0.44 QI:0/0.66/0.42/0.85/0.16/0/7/0/378